MKAKTPSKNTEVKKMPEVKFRSGALTATVWANETVKEDGEKFDNYSFNIERSYKDKEDKWQKTTSLRKRDVAGVTALLNKVSEYLFIDEDAEKAE